MTIKIWLDHAVQDAERRGLPSLRPLLESLARATSALRTADWNSDSSGQSDLSADPSAGALAKAEALAKADESASDAR